MITLKEIEKNQEIQTLLKAADQQLKALEFTEHSLRHVSLTAKRVREILTSTGSSEREIQLGEIAGYMHDIGNAVNRSNHAQSGGILAYDLLTKQGMTFDEAAQIMSAIGNHDEKTGTPVNAISAALIIADKCDVHRTRVRQSKRDPSQRLAMMADIHDRVNFAVESNDVKIDSKSKEIFLSLVVDTSICSAMDYFEIFLERMRMCKNAAKFLGYHFKMEINNYRLL